MKKILLLKQKRTAFRFAITSLISGVFSGLLLVTSASAAELSDLEALAASGKHRQVVSTADEIIGKNPNNPRPLFLKAQSLSQLNRGADAITVYTELTQTFPELPEPYNNLATLFMAEGQLDQARIALEKALATSDAYNTAFRNLSAVYREMASRAYRQAMNNTVQIDAVRLTAMSDIQTWQPEPIAPPVLLASNNPVEDDLITPSSNTASDIANNTANDESVSAAAGSSSDSTAAAETTPVESDTKTEEQPSDNGSGIEIAAVIDINDAQPMTEPDGIQTTGSEQDGATEDASVATAAAAKEVEAANEALIQEDLINTVQQWAKAWSSKDVNSYLAHYASEFKPENSGLTRSAWEEQRRGRLKWRKYIRVAVQKPKVKLNGNTAEVTFSQSYESDVYEDNVVKTLQMKRFNNDWKITRELSKA